ncbi:Cna B-type domain-containing protein, partial [Slackia exigua]|uniref:Cna B-type domain-containing protein n=1 Tax=Slackia exigua TaxID=84109 RepID=UPI00210C837A|nr:Cna B-type domain-containing protein [Slackia exigua]
MDISGTKSWDDDSDRDGVRPASITVNLMRDGAKADSRTVTPDASGAWAYAFMGLPKYAADGHEYAYTVTEEAVPNYATEVNGTDIVNSYTPGKTSVTVTKAWAD